MMRNAIPALAGLSFLALAGCDVDQTKEAKAPDVDVNVSGGQLPEYNVQGPDVDVGTVNKTVQVPTVDVKPPPKD
jgi:hypothetical protein